MNPKSHSKNAATWQEDLDERHFDYSSCFGAELVETCMIRLGVQERKRAKQERTFIASDKTKANTPVKPPVPNVPARRDN